MDRASKIKNALTMWLCALIVTLSLGETRAENFFATPSLELEQNQTPTQASTREITFAYGYDASDYALAPKSTLKYDPRIRARGVQDGVGHNFPYSFDNAITGTKGITLPRGATGYAVRGTHNGKDVVYNMVVKDGVITHRDFVSAKNWAQRSKSFGFNVDLKNLPTQ